MNVIKRSFFLFLITIFTFSFFIKNQPNAETIPANERLKLPDGTFQTPRAVKTGTPGPLVPKAPIGPQAPESPKGGAGHTGLSGPQGINAPQGLNGPQGPVRR